MKLKPGLGAFMTISVPTVKWTRPILHRWKVILMKNWLLIYT